MWHWQRPLGGQREGMGAGCPASLQPPGAPWDLQQRLWQPPGRQALLAYVPFFRPGAEFCGPKGPGGLSCPQLELPCMTWALALLSFLTRPH